MAPKTKSNWFKRLMLRLKHEFQWLAPGTGYKRWLVLSIIGAMLLGLGLAVVILQYYRSTTSPFLTPILALLSLRFLNRPIRLLLFGGIGFILILLGIWGANRSLLKPFETGGKPVWDTLQHYRQREKASRWS